VFPGPKISAAGYNNSYMILFITLKTIVIATIGQSSISNGLARQYSRMSSMLIAAFLPQDLLLDSLEDTKML
jgi:hypothetical protein